MYRIHGILAWSATRTAWLMAGFVLTALGCERGIPTGELSGTVMLDGKLLTHGAVCSTTKFGDSQGVIYPDGTFQLSLREQKGLVPAGHHRLSVFSYVGGEAPKGPEADAMLMIPYQYANPDTSGFEAKVNPNEETIVTLELFSNKFN